MQCGHAGASGAFTLPLLSSRNIDPASGARLYCACCCFDRVCASCGGSFSRLLPGPSILARRHARCLAECAIEARLRGELAAQRNIAQGSLAGCEQRHRVLQPLLADIAMRRRTHRRLEHPGEMERTEAGNTGELGSCDVLVEVLRDVIQDATQPDFVESVRSGSLQPDRRWFGVRMRESCRERE